MSAPITLIFTKGDDGLWSARVEIAGEPFALALPADRTWTDGVAADRAVLTALFLKLGHAVGEALITRRFE